MKIQQHSSTIPVLLFYVHRKEVLGLTRFLVRTRWRFSNCLFSGKMFSGRPFNFYHDFTDALHVLIHHFIITFLITEIYNFKILICGLTRSPLKYLSMFNNIPSLILYFYTSGLLGITKDCWSKSMEIFKLFVVNN